MTRPTLADRHLDRAEWLTGSRILIHHTDRGSQYASEDYRAALSRHGVRQSMCRRADCRVDAASEHFFSPMEHELLADAGFHTRREGHLAIAEQVASWYNVKRRHSTLGYVSTMQHEERLRHGSPQAARAA